MKIALRLSIIAILTILCMTIAFAAQADAITLYKDITNPIWMVNKEGIQYFVFWNHGSQYINLTRITFDFNASAMVNSILKSELGNDKITYLDVTANTSFNDTGTDKVIVNLTNPITIEPQGYAEWILTFKGASQPAQDNLTAIINASFTDGSNFTNRFFLNIKSPTICVSTAYKIIGLYNKFTEATGANNTIQNGTTYTFVFNTSEYSNHNFEGNATIKFSQAFTNITAVSGGTASATVCSGNSCNCTAPGRGISGDSFTCNVNATIPQLINNLDYTMNVTFTGPTSVYTLSELLLRPNPPPLQIHSCNISSTNFELPGSTTITAHVTPPFLTTLVQAQITGPENVNLTLNGGPIYNNTYTPNLTGVYNVTIKANYYLGNSVTLNCGSFNVTAPTQPLVIHNCTINPTTFELPNNTNISAYVTPPSLVTSVKAEITGPSNATINLSPPGPSYSNLYTPVVEGAYNVLIKANDSRGNSKNLSCTQFTASAPIIPPPVYQCEGIYSLGIALQPSIVDVNKTKALLNFNYYCAKNLLGLWTYNFYFEMKYINGSYVNLDGVDVKYGLYPPQGSTVYALNRPSLLNRGSYYEQVIVTIGVWV